MDLIVHGCSKSPEIKLSVDSSISVEKDSIDHGG